MWQADTGPVRARWAGMINARRAAVLPTLALTAALTAVLLPGTARAQFAPAPLTVDSTAKLAADGSVTLTGTYYCAPGSGPVLLDGEVVQGDRRADLDGVLAVCDGRLRTWKATGSPDSGSFKRGAARGEAVLMELSKGLPFPVGVRTAEKAITLTR